MAFTFLDAGLVSRNITKMRVQDGSLLRTILRMKVMDTDNTTLRTVATFAPSLSLSASPNPTTGFTFDTSATSALVTATPTGGLGPYTYAWTKISGTGGADTPSVASTSFTAFASPGAGTFPGVFRCTCTDSAGQVATADVNVTFVFALNV